jgi:hypothetical protein
MDKKTSNTERPNPNNAKTCIDKNGNKFYITGIQNDNGIWSATIKYIESGIFKKVSYNIIENYLS